MKNQNTIFFFNFPNPMLLFHQSSHFYLEWPFPFTSRESCILWFLSHSPQECLSELCCQACFFFLLIYLKITYAIKYSKMIHNTLDTIPGFICVLLSNALVDDLFRKYIEVLIASAHSLSDIFFSSKRHLAISITVLFFLLLTPFCYSVYGVVNWSTMW